MIAEFAAAMTALKETVGLVRVINEAKTDAEIKDATFELQSKLLALQSDCFSLGDAIRLRDEEVAYLKGVIEEFDNFKSESEGYELHRTEGNTLVYSRRVTVGGSEVLIYACPYCYQQRKMSLLQPGVDKGVKGSYWVHYCPSCKSEYKMDKTPAANAAIERTNTRSSGYSRW